MTLAQISTVVLSVIIAGFGVTILYLIWTGKIDLSHLLSEANGQASMSRFQLLIFTFVISISLFELVEVRGAAGFPDIPSGVLTLLGISASTYAVGKGISYSQPDIMMQQSRGDGQGEGESTEAQAAADQAQAHAATAQAALEATLAAKNEAVVHSLTAQKAAIETAENLAKAQDSPKPGN